MDGAGKVSVIRRKYKPDFRAFVERIDPNTNHNITILPYGFALTAELFI
jgi:hypothetical protein